MTKPIYLDYNGTTPHDPEVISAMRPYLEEEFGNPSSSHQFGAKPRQAVLTAREQIASLLNCRPQEIIFTSGGTESNNFAIKGIARTCREKGNHIITSQIEHPAVLEVGAYLEKNGFEVTYLPVDKYGLISASEVASACTPQTILISIMQANNEVGTIEPLQEISEFTRKRGIILHTDAAQSIGKIAVDTATLGVDLLSIAGHKIYAPKGIGALYIRDGVRLETCMHGAGQEAGKRAGTENVLQIVGLGKACEIAKRDMERNTRQMQMTRDRLYVGIKKGCKQVQLNGHPEKRLPNTLNLSFHGLEANRILEKISVAVAASAGAACHANSVAVSHVLQAMGIPLDWATGTVRLTTGRTTTMDDIDSAVKIITHAVNSMRK
jgi:cysteine desulfurase